MAWCDGAECHNIPVACECVSVSEESWSGGVRLGERAVGVIAMSGSKI